MTTSTGAATRTQGRIQQRHVRRLIGLALLIAGITATGTAAATARSGQVATADRGSLGLTASYTLRTRLSWAANRLDVVETIDAVNGSGRAIDAVHLSVLARAFGELRVGSVTVDGSPVHATYPDRASMRVALPSVLEPGGSIRLVVRFTDRPGADVHDSLHARLSRAEGLMRVADWFPLLSDGHGLRNPGDSQVSAAATSITLDLVTDRDLVVAAPGSVIVADGRHHVVRLENARDYAFAVGLHLRQRSTVTRDGVVVRTFVPDGVAATRTLRLARRAMEAYDDAYGPYPWPELILAPTPGGWIATESPGLVFLGADTWERPDVVRHEVAHEWFYGLIGVDQLREPWLDEAFATFSEHALFAGADWSYCSGRPVDTPTNAFPDTFDRWGCGGYVETVYAKGAAMIQGVRTRLGDRVFFATMRRFIAAHRFGLIAGVDVIRAWLGAATSPGAMRSHLARFLSDRTMHLASDPARRSAQAGTPQGVAIATVGAR